MKVNLLILFFSLSFTSLLSQDIVSVFRIKKKKVEKVDRYLERIKKSEIILYNDSTYKFYYKTNKFKIDRKKGIITGLYEIRDKHKVLNGEVIFYQNEFEIFKSFYKNRI